MTPTQKVLTDLAAINNAKFMEHASPATSRQINFLAAILDNNKVDIEDFISNLDDYNGGFAWGLDKECASAFIGLYATKRDMKIRAEIINRRGKGETVSYEDWAESKVADRDHIDAYGTD